MKIVNYCVGGYCAIPYPGTYFQFCSLTINRLRHNNTCMTGENTLSMRLPRWGYHVTFWVPYIRNFKQKHVASEFCAVMFMSSLTHILLHTLNDIHVRQVFIFEYKLNTNVFYRCIFEWFNTFCTIECYTTFPVY